MTSAIDSDSFGLFTPSLRTPANQFVSSSLLIVSEPFSPTVWLLLGLTVVLVSVALWFVEISQTNPAVATSINARKGPAGFAFSAYLVTMAFFGGSLPATRWPTRLVALGLMIFVYVHTNCYTASLATALVTVSPQPGLVASIKDLAARGRRLCVYESMASAAGAAIGASVQTVQMNNYGPMLEKVADGNCSAALVGRFEALTFIRASAANFTVCTARGDPDGFAACRNSSIPAEEFRLSPLHCGDRCARARRFCGLVDAHDPAVALISLAWALPVAEALEPWVSAAITARQMTGLVADLQQRELVDPNPPICPEAAGPSGRLSLQQLSGAFLLGAVGIFAGGVLHAAKRGARRQLRAAADPGPAALAGLGDAAMVSESESEPRNVRPKPSVSRSGSHGGSCDCDRSSFEAEKPPAGGAACTNGMGGAGAESAARRRRRRALEAECAAAGQRGWGLVARACRLVGEADWLDASELAPAPAHLPSVASLHSTPDPPAAQARARAAAYSAALAAGAEALPFNSPDRSAAGGPVAVAGPWPTRGEPDPSGALTMSTIRV